MVILPTISVLTRPHLAPPKITYIDGEKGILLYRGYPIEQLASQSDFLEVCYLLLKGELPNKTEYKNFCDHITHHTMSTRTTPAIFSMDSVVMHIPWPLWLV